jgi:hypothetical protein
MTGFRGEVYRCLTARADELFELADAVLCADGPVKTLAGLSLAPEHRRGHGALYDAVSHGRMDIARLRRVLAGHWRQGDPRVLVIFDAGYDVTRLSWLLADLPVDLLGRLRSDRVMQLPAPPPRPGALGSPRKHGGELALADPATWPAPQLTTSTSTPSGCSSRS